jgi:hypothetical protein
VTPVGVYAGQEPPVTLRPARRARTSSERGVALLSVLGLLAVLLVLGSLVATSSRFESALSGTSKQSARAFAAADAGLGYALGDADNFVQLGTRCTDLAGTGVPVTGDVCVRFDYEAPPPPEIRVSALSFKAFHFQMDATGTAPPHAESTLGMEATRLGPSSGS